MPPVGVAIVGCGRISDLHFLGYQGTEDARVVAVCDPIRRRAQEKAQAWRVPQAYTDYRDVLRDRAVDLVELLVPHHLHASMAIAACEARKHVSVQKPMALSVGEADRMIDAAYRSGVLLRIYENFIFYPPYVRAREMVQAGEIGEPRMLRIHMNTGTRDSAWRVPLRSWLWRLDERRGGAGPIVFDHGYHLFSLACDLMGAVDAVHAWIDRTAVIPTKSVDAPAVVTLRFKGERRYAVMDFVHTPKMRIHSDYYADDNRLEIVGERGILFVNRWTARTIDLPVLMLFREGRTTAIAVDREGWEASFVDCTRHLLEVLRRGGEPKLDGATGRRVLQSALAAQSSAKTGRAVSPDEMS